MAKTEIAKPTDTAVSRPRDIFSAMRSEMDRMFERFEHGFPRLPLFRADHATVMVPDLEVRENASAITVEAELPGVEEKDISVTLSNAERSYGAFERSLQLPDSIDETKVDAKFDKGVLKIIAAKKPEAVKAQRKIEIKKAS